MKKSIKKSLSLVMAVMMLLSCFAVTASAATATYNGYSFTYTSGKTTATLDKTTSSSQTWKLPSTVSRTSGKTIYDYTVTAINSSFFYNSTYSKSVTYLRLPATLENIQNGLFQSQVHRIKTIEIYGADTTCNDIFMGCDALTEFIVNENNTTLKAVDGVLFNNGGLKLQKFPAAKTLAEGTVYEVPDGTDSIGAYAFYKAKNITEVNVPATVETVGRAAFCGGKITAVDFEEGSTYSASAYKCDCGTCFEKGIFCANGHKSEFVERKDAACGINAVNVYKCSVCGLTEEKEIPGTALSHTGGTATCSALAVCGTCGEAYGEYNADAHSFTNYVYNNDAACEKDGTKTASCDYGCGKENTVTAEGTAKKHAFLTYKISSEATCSKNSKEAAVCENGCGKTDEREIEGSALGHSFTAYDVIRVESCKADRQEKAFCDNGCGAYDVRTVKDTKLEHKAGEAVITGQVAPTCEKAGSYVETVKCEICTSVLSSEMKNVPALGHTDADGDNICDNGGEKLSSPQDDCTHMCHKSGFMGFIWKIVRFFQKLFKLNPVCECGAVHY